MGREELVPSTTPGGCPSSETDAWPCVPWAGANRGGGGPEEPSEFREVLDLCCLHFKLHSDTFSLSEASLFFLFLQKFADVVTRLWENGVFLWFGMNPPGSELRPGMIGNQTCEELLGSFSHLVPLLPSPLVWPEEAAIVPKAIKSVTGRMKIPSCALKTSFHLV